MCKFLFIKKCFLHADIAFWAVCPMKWRKRRILLHLLDIVQEILWPYETKLKEDYEVLKKCNLHDFIDRLLVNK